MPYPNEISSGEVLRSLENNPAFKEFRGKILSSDDIKISRPTSIDIKRQHWTPWRVIAIDGSQITAALNHHFPVAEAGLVTVSVVSINLKLLQSTPPGGIPNPRIFHDMEKSMSFVNEPVPGVHVVEKDKPGDSDVRFFRRTVYQIFAREFHQAHETLLDTLRDVAKNIEGKCPTKGCEEIFKLNKKECPVCKETWYATDVLRLHEYFIDTSSSAAQAHSRLRATLEVIVLLNLLRFFAAECPKYLADCLFVLDGPLATFGAPASILGSIKEELLRINKKSREANGQDVALIGIEKSGILYQHWEQLDFDPEKGPRTWFNNGTVITPNSEYIRKYIKFNDQESAHGEGTHFGRFVLYKTNKGEHVVLNTAMLSKHSQEFKNDDLSCFHRLGDALDVMDELATYLYRDGFLPLVRAHANAAIPLKRGTDIIRGLFEDQ